jgi:tetrahydromethanopterin S-methyltransferase subunit G
METMTVPGAEKQIDELSKRVDFGFGQTTQRLGRVEDDVRELRTEMNAGFRQVDAGTAAGFDHADSRTKAGFQRVDAEFDRVHQEFGRINDRFDKVDEKFDKVNDEFTAVRAEMKAGFDGVQRLMTRFFAGTLGTIVAGVVVSAVLSHF